MALPPGIIQFLRGQLLQTPPLPTTDLTGQTIIVTGANTGLGLECAKHMVRLNVSTLILACRSIDKGEAAKELLLSSKRTTEKATTKIEVWPLDMSRYASVLEFADRCERSLTRLDAVVENAGISQPIYQVAEDNESTITVNVISTFLIAFLTLPKLRESAARHGKMGRLSIVGSAVHFWADTKDLDVPEGQSILERLNKKETANMKNRYFMSKLLVMLYVQELAKKIITSSCGDEATKTSFVVVNNVAPGWCRTELFRNENSLAAQNLVLKMIGRSSEEGARTLVHAATKVGIESHGEYLSECQVKSASPFVRSTKGKETKARLWKELMAKLENIRPGVTKIM